MTSSKLLLADKNAALPGGVQAMALETALRAVLGRAGSLVLLRRKKIGALCLESVVAALPNASTTRKFTRTWNCDCNQPWPPCDLSRLPRLLQDLRQFNIRLSASGTLYYAQE